MRTPTPCRRRAAPPPAARSTRLARAVLAALASLVACDIAGRGNETIAESPGVVVSLPVARADSSASPIALASEGGGAPGAAEGPPMEVPAVPAGSAPPVSGAPAAADTSLEGDAYLLSRHLMVPVAGVDPSALHDTFGEDRGGGSRLHGALDILAPRGTPVLAADDGRVEKLHLSDAGGITLYQVDPSGRYVYYYAHLERYRDGIAEGDLLRRGEPLGYVGTSGNAPPGTPHLHFAIGRMDEERRWWKYEPINPLRFLVEPGRERTTRPAR